MKKNIRLLPFLILLGLLFIVQSCQNEETIDNGLNPGTVVLPEEEIASFTQDDLKLMASQLEKSGLDVSSMKIEALEDTSKTKLASLVLRAVKVTCKYPNPNNNGTYIDLSGVLLVPKKTIFTSLSTYRILVAAPGTSTYNPSSPSNVFKGNIWSFTDEGDFNYYYFYTLQAASGYVVLMPDYPGFGDSHKQCFHPYLDSKTLTNSTIALIKAAKNKLSAEGYRYKDELVVTGYSQGGFVAASLAKELDTNPSHGLKIKGVVAGGTPCNLKQIADIARKSGEVGTPHYLPYALWGYKMNRYPTLNVKDYLLEPYASTSMKYFDGTYKDAASFFPKKNASLYTEDVIKYFDTSSKMVYVNQILKENSVEPWKNKCKFVMTHGANDVTVYYQNAYEFAQKQKAMGGNITFVKTIGDHVLGFIPYYTRTSSELWLMK